MEVRWSSSRVDFVRAPAPEVSCSGISMILSLQGFMPPRGSTPVSWTSAGTLGHAVILGLSVLWAWSPELLILLGLGRANPEVKLQREKE